MLKEKKEEYSLCVVTQMTSKKLVIIIELFLLKCF